MIRITHGLLIILVAAVGCSPAMRVDRYRQRADAFFERQRYAEAIIEYANVLKRAPDDAHALRHLALSLYATRDFPNAEPLLLRAVVANPDDHEAKTKLATVYLAASDYEQAIRWSSDALARNTNDLDALLVWASANRRPAQARPALDVLVASESKHRASYKYQLARSALHVRLNEWEEARAALDEAVRLAPDQADAFLARGHVRMQRGEFDDAANDFKKAVERSPGATVAGVQWALYLRERGDAEGARAALSEILAASPDFIPALYERAALAFAVSDYESVRVDTGHILERSPGHLPSLLLRCAVMAREGGQDAAAVELQKIAAQFPRSAQARFALARIYSRRGELDAARQWLQEALALQPDYQEASLLMAEIDIQRGEYVAALGRLTPLAADSGGAQASALLLIGHAHRLQGNVHAAIEAYEKIAARKADLPEPVFFAGTLYHALGRTDEAIAAFERALDRQPAYVPALQGLVTMWMRDGHIDSARQRMSAMLSAHPQVAELHLLNAAIAMAADDLASAEQSLARTIALRPDLSVAYRDLGRLYMRQNRVDDAVVKLELATEADDNDVTARMMLGTLYQQAGRVDDAIRLYRDVLNRNAHAAAAHNNLAFLLAGKPDQLDEAMQHAQRARALSPHDPAIADTLGMIALRKKMFPWALMLLQESATQMGDDPVVLFHLARAHIGLGQEAEALRALEKALARSDDFEERPRAHLLASVLRLPVDTLSSDEADELNKLAGMMPDDPAVNYRQARWRESSGDRAGAIRLHENILGAHPDYVPSLVRLVTLYDDEPATALSLGRRARARAPSDPLVNATLGRAALRAGDYAWSFSLLGEAVRQTNDVAVKLDYAVSAIFNGRGDAARDALAENDDAAANEIREWLDVYQRGAPAPNLVHLSDARLEPMQRIVGARHAAAPAAEATYRALIAEYPVWPWPVRDLAALMIRTGPVNEETIAMASRARELMPSDPVAARTYGLALAMSDRSRDAIIYLRDAVSRNASDANARLWLARCEWSEGMREKAASNLVQAIDAGLSVDDERMARAMIARIAMAEDATR